MISPSQLAMDFQIAIAMCADENGLSTAEVVDRFESQLHDAVDYGLEAAHERAHKNDPEIEL